jgi:hypothetical protein
MTLRCVGCGSDRLIEYGAPSKLDGKKSYKCESCNLEHGPLRSRAVLWSLFVLSSAVFLGCSAYWIYDRFLGEHKSTFQPVYISIIFAAFVAAAIVELRKPVPLREGR